jgi:outer membrane protein assembly factor BamD
MYIRPMKKTTIKIFNLLIILILCLIFGDAAAATSGEFIQKNNHSSLCKTNEMMSDYSSSVDIKNKKKKKEKKKRRIRKINFDSFQQYYEKAINYYNKKAWISAARIFEELYPLSIGTPLGDTILFYFADSYFQNRDYQMASMHFRDYVRRYPGTEKTELAALNAVKSMYHSSPEYYLDQFVTIMAIEEVNLFIQTYPYSKHIEECNEMLDALRDKLAKKEMEMVKMYFNTGNYEAAQIISSNFLKTYSYSKYASEVLYVLIQNNFDFARKSIESKQYYRYKDCVEAFEMLLVRFPESSFVTLGKKIADEALVQINRLDKK